jgi:hypothetical protein
LADFIFEPLATDFAALFVAAFGFATGAAGRASTSGIVSSSLPLSSVVSVPAAGSFDSNRGNSFFFVGCHVCWEPTCRIFVSSRAASSGVSRPRCVYRSRFTLLCRLICGT